VSRSEETYDRRTCLHISVISSSNPPDSIPDTSSQREAKDTIASTKDVSGDRHPSASMQLVLRLVVFDSVHLMDHVYIPVQHAFDASSCKVPLFHNWVRSLNRISWHGSTR
jgi:hypothetical protein